LICIAPIKQQHNNEQHVAWQTMNHMPLAAGAYWVALHPALTSAHNEVAVMPGVNIVAGARCNSNSYSCTSNNSNSQKKCFEKSSDPRLLNPGV
jgi:hypothetical protein